MEPVSATMGAEVAVSVLAALVKSREHFARLVDAVRGAKHKKSLWFSMCKELVDNCKVLTPLFQNLESEIRQANHTLSNMDDLEDALDVLSSALDECTELVKQCQSASTATLFFRGETMKERFRKVADRIARCLQNIPVASFRTTLEIQRDVNSIKESLKSAR